MEGFYISGQAHFIQQLAKRLGPNTAGYSLSGSGYKLGEYVVVGRALREQGIHPDTLVVFINQGDFYRAVLDLGGTPGIAPRIDLGRTGAGELIPGRAGPPRSLLRRALRQSATARYLIFNARLNPFATGPAELAMSVGDNPEDDPARRAVYDAAFDFVVSQLQEALPNTRLVFMVDADRARIMADQAPKPLPTSDVVRDGCRRRGCAAIDLTSTFVSAWQRDREPLNFAHNPHWNAYSHALAAMAVERHLRLGDSNGQRPGTSVR